MYATDGQTKARLLPLFLWAGPRGHNKDDHMMMTMIMNCAMQKTKMYYRTYDDL